LGFLQALALPLLSCWTINLEHAQSLRRIWIAQSKRIEACPQHYDLTHTTIDRVRKAIFRETTARHDERPKAIRILSHEARYGVRIFAADRDRERVGKYRSAFYQLVSRAEKRSDLCRQTGSVLHVPSRNLAAASREDDGISPTLTCSCHLKELCRR
jgi:hypothetical protein